MEEWKGQGREVLRGCGDRHDLRHGTWRRGGTHFVGVRSASVELGNLLALLAVVHKELAICSTCHKQAAVRGEPYGLTEAGMVLWSVRWREDGGKTRYFEQNQNLVLVAQLEGRPSVEAAAVVLASSGDAEGSGLVDALHDSPVSTKVARVDGLGVPDDLAHGGTSVPDDTRGEDLLALATNNNTIAVWTFILGSNHNSSYIV